MESKRKEANRDIHEGSSKKQQGLAESRVRKRKKAETDVSSEKVRLRVPKFLRMIDVVEVQRVEIRLKINEPRHFI